MSRSMAVILSLFLFLALLTSPGSSTFASSRLLIDEDRVDLAIGLSVEPETLDPHRATSTAAATVIMSLFDTLLVRDGRGDFQPGLAESWDISDDGKEYTFHLRDRVTFHDGTPFDAAAVKFNVERIADPTLGSRVATTLLGPYSHTDVIDPMTVRIVFDEPHLAFLDNASQPFLSMVAPKAASSLGDEFGHHPVGTGFLAFDDWVEGDRIILTRNGEYTWGSPAFANSGPVAFDRMTVRFYPEESQRLAAFLAGDVDILDQVQPRDIAVLSDERAYRELNATAPGIPISLVLNTDAFPTDDLAVRQALNHALDREQIVSFAFRGASQPARAPLAPDTLYASVVTAAELPYDLDYAGSLLDAAGWVMQDSGIREKEGKQLVLRWAIGPLDAQWAELAQAQFSQLGAVVQIVPRDKDLNEALFLDDVNMVSVAFPGSDPGVLQQLFAPEGTTGEATPVSASNIDLAALLHDAATASRAHNREAVYTEVQEQIMADALIVPVALLPENVVVAAEVAGVRRDFRNGLWLHDAVIRNDASE